MENNFDKDGNGTLWADDAEIIRKGSFNWEGEKRYGAIVKSKNNQGKEKYEFMVSVGLLFTNPDKTNPRTPDISGKITIDKEPFKFGAWKKTTEDGRDYTSIGITQPKTKEENESVDVEINEEECPF
jgi:uncharacterized protein (DUF736 family)